MRWSPTSWREALTLFQRLSASITIGHSKTFLYNPEWYYGKLKQQIELASTNLSDEM